MLKCDRVGKNPFSSEVRLFGLAQRTIQGVLLFLFCFPFKQGLSQSNLCFGKKTLEIAKNGSEEGGKKKKRKEINEEIIAMVTMVTVKAGEVWQQMRLGDILEKELERYKPS